MSTADINAINQSLANIQSSFNDITGNTLSNYNQLSRIVSQQGNIYNTIYFGLGNLSTGNLNFTGNLFQNGSPYIGSQWTTLNGNIYYSSGNVGIKKTTPNFELDVNGNINLSGNLFQNGSPYIASQWTTSGSNIYYNVANGNVGIGTTTPYYALDIGGSANISSNVYCMNMFIINDCLVQGGDFSIMNGNLTVYKQFNTFGESVLNGNLTVYNADFYNYGNSYVYNGLYLNKNGALYTNNDVAGQHAFYSFDTVNLMSTLYGGADDTNRVGYFQARGYGGGLPLLLNPNGGNVGVGTGNPNTTLDVNGSVSISGVCYSSGSGSTYLNGNQLNAEYNINATAELAINYSGYLGGTTQFRDTTFFNGKNTIIAKLVGSSGNLGLGTTSPTATLDVNGDANISGNIFCKNYLRVLSDDSASKLVINAGYKAAVQTSGYVTYNIYSGTGTHYFMDDLETGGNLGVDTQAQAKFHVNGNAIITGNLNVDNGLLWTDPVNNRVGILNTNPQYELDIKGSANISNSIISKNGISLGTNGSVVSVIQKNDNLSGAVYSLITLDNTNLPSLGFGRQTVFSFAKELTSGAATSILTINYISTTFSEHTFFLKIEGMIQASTGGDSSVKSLSAYITGCRANATSGVFTLNSTQLSSAIAATTSGTLLIGATTITYPVNTTTSTSIALTQAMTGTPSQSLFIVGECTIYQASPSGATFIESVTF